ncbi:DUF6129 family protein [Marinobacter sp.]|uniref:DUF6129 family protein n=1 Tax=Marinobacter sp. TaxID=50741 RepID=UPI0019A68618|nr:DUF6129 family protein [Marinobacter sp.]MBC7191593.1 hypothetical protein [Marinobacter sp.]MDY6815214.1 DUF6129 family protein [Pseudomonadota bacterium]
MITAENLHRLAQDIERLPDNQRDERINTLFPEARVTICTDDDIPAVARPVHQGTGFDLYLVDASQTCATLTNDVDTACGVVLALHDDGEG